MLIGTAPNVTYDSNPNYNGPDSFTFRVNDGQVEQRRRGHRDPDGHPGERRAGRADGELHDAVR